MKNLLFTFLITCSFTAFSQIEVTTVTPEIEGSGGLSLDEDGNLFIADFCDFLGMADPNGLPNHILQMDTDFNITQYATDFIGASGNAFDSNGVLFQSDIRASAIYKIVNGVRTFVTDDGIVSPVGIAFDSNDNFYVCNCGDNTIRKVTSSGTSTLFASGSLFACPNGMTVDEDDNIYVVNFSNTNIVKITPSGTTSVVANTNAGNGHIDYDSNSRNLYVASYSGNLIFSVNIDDEEIEVIAGTGVRGNDDGPATTATFSTPNGIAVSATGDSIYVNCAVPLSGAMINPQIIRLITGVNSLSVPEFSVLSNVFVYPNPASDVFTIEGVLTDDFGNLNIRIYDIQGKLIRTIDTSLSEGLIFKQTISISTLKAGNYLFTISEGDTQIYSGKLIKH